MELSFFEILLVGAIAFLVLGPQEMIRLSQKLGSFVGRTRTQMNNFKIMAQEELLKDKQSKSDGPQS